MLLTAIVEELLPWEDLESGEITDLPDVEVKPGIDTATELFAVAVVVIS
jgi:hypothetical protein